MAIDILFFGSLIDVTQVSQASLPDLPDTDALTAALNEKFPSLQTKKYFIAINREMIQENKTIKTGDIVALMPPFSGG